MLLANLDRRGPARLPAQRQHRADAGLCRIVFDRRGSGLFVGLLFALLSKEGLFKGLRCRLLRMRSTASPGVCDLS